MDSVKLLQQTGMSDAEIRAYLKKLDEFFEPLSPKEKRVFLAGRRSMEEALHSFRGQLTANELREFIKLRMPPSATEVLCIEGIVGSYPDHAEPLKD